MISHRHENARRLGLALLGAVVCFSSLSATPVRAAVPSEHERTLRIAEHPGTPPAAAAASGRKITVEHQRVDGQDAQGCRRLPATRAIVKLNLKPETDIVDLVAWISSITCRQFLLPGGILAPSRKITVYAPQLITPDGAYRLFLSALDSIGLTVQKSGRFFRIIETAKAKNSALPLYGFDGQLLSGEED